MQASSAVWFYFGADESAALNHLVGPVDEARPLKREALGTVVAVPGVHYSDG